MGAEIGCMISEGPWLFVGGPNAIKGLRLLHGGHDGDGRPVLMCSAMTKPCAYMTAFVSLRREARIFSMEEIQLWISWIEVCSSLGDGTWQDRVWKWSSEQKTEAVKLR
ncbi:hypothetical protein Syun_017381 [Stephania yunnanensis]|uniref:Uncharacterized protein n=1 Tax=Stephania yunnanensis TaxID=152371 RepID=A0AAP0J6Y7_9MAGN